MTRRARWLVFAVGNPSRGDDAVGPALVERLQAWLKETGDLPIDLKLLTDFQWQVEHALDLEGVEVALFVDASVSARPPFELRRLAPRFDVKHTTHSLAPDCVLAIAERLGQELPEAWLLSLPGRAFELGAEPCAESCACCDAAFAALCAGFRRGILSAALPLEAPLRAAAQVGLGPTV